MTAHNPKPPFRVATFRDETIVGDADNASLATFRGPDHQARAEALAAEYGQTYGPEWVVDAGTARLRSRSGAVLHVFCDRPEPGRDVIESGGAFRAHICRLLNEHGGPQ